MPWGPAPRAGAQANALRRHGGDAVPSRPAPAPEQPHVILVICHDLGRHLPCYGLGGLRTPHLDRLAADGAVLTRYFATAPLCSPSRGSMLTGCYPHANGLMGLVNRGWDMPDRTPTLPQLLRDAGYITYLFGFQHEKRDARRSGYDHLLQVRGPHHAASILPSVAEFLHGARESTRGNPFLAVVGLSEVHRPFQHARYEPQDPAGVDVPGFLPDEPAVRRDLGELAGMVQAVDEQMGLLLDTLADTGLDRQTLVMLTTDHGIAFPRAKSTLYDAGLGTALLARLPGVIPAGTVVDALLSNIDLLPTLLEAAGREAPAHVQGRSFWGLLRGPAPAGAPPPPARAPGPLPGLAGLAGLKGAAAAGTPPAAVPAAPRTAIFAEKTWHDSYDPIRAIRTERWKYIRNFEARPELVLPADIAASPSAEVPEIAAALQRPRAPEELYDLGADPWETHNLAGVAAHEAVRAELAGRLQAWMQETQDPLLAGPIPDAPH